jgi:hypothetical protein
MAVDEIVQGRLCLYLDGATLKIMGNFWKNVVAKQHAVFSKNRLSEKSDNLFLLKILRHCSRSIDTAAPLNS